MNLVSQKRQLAGRIAGHAELLDLRAFNLTAELLDGSPSAPYDIHATMTPSGEVGPYGTDDSGEWLVAYSFEYSFKLMSDDVEVANVGCVYNAAYQVVLKEQPTEAEMQAFGDTTVHLAFYPYVRQYVQDATGRLGLPPTILPLYREPVQPEQVDALPSGSSTAARSRKAAAKKAPSKKAIAKKAPTKKAAAKKPPRSQR